MAVRIFHLFVFAAALLPVHAAVANADDGPPRTLLAAADRLRPAETIERVASATPVRILVSLRGYASTATERTYFQPLYDAMPERRPLDAGNELGNYDTRGALAVNGEKLKRSIQRYVSEEDVDDVAIVGVSQGGVVAVETLRAGLSARDNVTSVTTIASPLNGSTTAGTVRMADDLATALGAHAELAQLVSVFGGGVDDPAMVDLSKSRRFTPPADIHFTQFWSDGDELVLSADANVPGATRRTLTPLPFIGPGHGGQVGDPRTRAMVVDAIRGNDVTAPTVESRIADLIAPVTDGIRLAVLIALAIGFVAVAFLLMQTRQVVHALRQVVHALKWSF